MNTKILLGAAGLTASLLVAPAFAADFDGNWAVQLLTESGTCDSALKATVDVTGGRVSNASMFVTTNGSVDPRGRVAIHMSGAGHTLAANGTLAAHGGSGTWVSPSHQCKGRWVASRL